MSSVPLSLSSTNEELRLIFMSLVVGDLSLAVYQIGLITSDAEDEMRQPLGGVMPIYQVLG